MNEFILTDRHKEILINAFNLDNITDLEKFLKDIDYKPNIKENTILWVLDTELKKIGLKGIYE
jgi:hypothetical protein